MKHDNAKLAKLAEFTPEQFEKEYNRIKNAMLQNKKPQKRPCAYIFGGQPGAGKTTLQNMFAERDANVVTINGDAFREHHPNYFALNKAYGNDDVKYTQAFANSVVSSLIERLSSENYNLAIEGTLRTAEVPMNTCRMLKEKGYNVELSVMAVDKETSWKSTIDRYNQMKQNGKIPRATPKESHDTTVRNLPGNLEEIYKSRIFDKITIYNRNLDCLYNSEKTPRKSPSPIIEAALNNITGRTENPLLRDETTKQPSMLASIRAKGEEYQKAQQNDHERNIAKQPQNNRGEER